MLFRYLLGCLIVCGNLFAAEATLGPERPLVPVRLGPAAYTQSDLMVAAIGSGFLAVWKDLRELGPYPYPYYASRLDADGRPAEAFGHRLAINDAYRLASNGHNALLIFIRNGDHYVQPLNDDGVPEDAERKLDSITAVHRLASNGETYLAVVTEKERRDELIALSLDARGVVVGRQPTGLRYANISPPHLLELDVNGRNYDLIGYGLDCATCTTPVLKTIADRGGSMTITETKIPLSVAYGGRAKMTEDRILFALPPAFQGDEVMFAIVDRAGRIVKQATSVILPRERLDIEWDGSEFLLVGGAGNNLHAVRVRPDGSLDSSDPYVISNSALGDAQVVSNRMNTILFWRDTAWSPYGDLVARPLRRFAELAAAPVIIAPITFSGRPQTNVQIASVRSRHMAVWRDEGHREIIGAVDGVEFTIDRLVQFSPFGLPWPAVGNPVITAAGDRFLVAWYQQDWIRVTTHLLVRRYALDGTAIDAQPVEISSGYKIHALDDAPGVTADGFSFVISDDLLRDENADMELRLLRIDAGNGFVSEIRRHTISDCYHCWGSSPPVATAAGWMVP